VSSCIYSSFVHILPFTLEALTLALVPEKLNEVEKSPQPGSRRGLDFGDIEPMHLICPTRQDLFFRL